ncbi:hypothetical protein [uncultured Thiocystis sp.]|uniref:hypothetical protein n=1 Tax=uncultured Thiocystis sp. TaxID=1202134 RepID=UPI0025FF5BD2|nr:hypothetical protein [uncultured Thiocystis sp.]
MHQTIDEHGMPPPRSDDSVSAFAAMPRFALRDAGPGLRSRAHPPGDDAGRPRRGVRRVGRSTGASRLTRRWLAGAGWICLLPGILAGASVTSAEPVSLQLAQTSASMHQQPAHPDVSSLWLEEVRAQRQAWEARRHETREAYEARRRLHNPRGAAQQDAWKEDARRQRSERLERIERDRERFRELGPYLFPLPWPGNLPLPFSSNEPDSAGLADPREPMFAPQGWDNLWYFRGY